MTTFSLYICLAIMAGLRTSSGQDRMLGNKGLEQGVQANAAAIEKLEGAREEGRNRLNNFKTEMRQNIEVLKSAMENEKQNRVKLTSQLAKLVESGRQEKGPEGKAVTADFGRENVTADVPASLHFLVKEYSVLKAAVDKIEGDIERLGNLYTFYKEIDCDSPPDIDNALVHLPANTFYGSEATYSCVRGYKYVSGSRKTKCRIDGVWSHSDFKCNQIRCSSSPPGVNHATVRLLNGSVFRSVVRYQCANGYYMTGGRIGAHCQLDGTWTKPTGSCAIIDCGMTRTVPHADVQLLNGTNLRSVARYTCHDRYRPTAGSVHSTCGRDRAWSDSHLVCEEKCPVGRGYQIDRTSGVCFKVMLTRATWTDAKKLCADDGGELIQFIETGFLNLLKRLRILNVFIEHFWIGCRSSPDRKKIVWSNGKEINVPRSSRKRGGCCAFSFKNYRLYQCTRRYSSACQISQ